MKLSDIFSLLTNGEMSQLYTGIRDSDGVDEDHQRQIGGSVQLALTALYTRFNLKYNSLTLRIIDGKTDYALKSQFADNGLRTTEPVRWVADTADAPFRDDILKIERVTTPYETVLDLNNIINPFSVSTPTMDTLRIPKCMATPTPGTPEYLKVDTLNVAYKANHPVLMPRLGMFNPDTIEVELPTSHVQALLYYVASRASNPVGMGQEFNGGNQWYQKYELECRRLIEENMRVDTGSQMNRLRQKGFV